MTKPAAEDIFIIRRIARLHWLFIGLVIILGAIGVAILYSAAQGNLDPWALRHFKRFLLGIAGMIFIAIIHIRIWFSLAYWFYILGLLFLLTVEVMGFIGMGAQRWINIAGINFQPSEMMKIVLILALARYFHCLHLNNLQKVSSMIVPALLIIIPALLILKQPNLGTATLLLMLGVSIFFMAGISWKKFVTAGVLAGASLPIIWNYMRDYQRQRVMTFLNPEADPLGAGYNIMQSKIALGSGGLSGKGFLQGSQSQLSFLPEKQTDFVFTMLAEEFGFMGGFTTIVFFIILIIVGIKIAMQCNSYFGKLTACGVITMVFLHVFINMAMAMGMIPVVGVPLPLLSYGGSNLLATLIGFGFVLNAHVHHDVQVGRSVS